MGGEKHPDGVSTVPATAEDLETYARASQELAAFRSPVLVSDARPHERLYLAAFDGTGNSMLHDEPERHTNVARIYQQVEQLNDSGVDTIRGGYVEGVGTQGGWSGLWDQMTGRTYDPRLEEMYLQFVRQAHEWMLKDPGAEVRLATIGFSRGGEQAAGFTRLVEERGIQNPVGAVIERDRHGLITSATYPGPPLRAPGSVVQAVGLFDPVGTGEPRDHDRRPPPAVVSGFQIWAADEFRDLFKGTYILDPGATADGRFLSVRVAGAHSDIGRGYALDGLGIRSGNLMIDYLNSLSDRPFLQKAEEPTDPRRNVIHRSEEHLFIYRTSIHDRTGERGHVDLLAPPALCRIDCRDAEPRNEVMAAGLTWRPVAIGPVPPGMAAQIEALPHVSMVGRLLEAAREGDIAKVERLTRDHAASAEGQAWLQRGQAQLQEAERSGPPQPGLQVPVQQAPAQPTMVY
ncbi:T6SS phospholipase effector Tle1-like catalytic domain-containing protein [Coralloluteibacterium stylophorae]|uniref:DUF2235 domain-containing protein n=1 Tax=Coralloluteibacterium stylophorae TaxID=1776034 RepID=A0A8J7VV67_9GAMM|nr:DUF2235 domain-containing protein [Coralloluteibacterium stylophorae]MBS7456377.1 DUF2235 domain-containing protein [Coralloluteibacterium stylophorae]